MSFGDTIINLLDPIDVLTEYSRLKQHRNFNTAILTWTIWLVSEPKESRCDEKDGIIKEIESQAKELGENGFRSWLIRESDKIILPVFSSQNLAGLFVKNLVREKNEIYSVGMSAVAGEFLLGIDLDEVEIVMNYKTDKVTGLNRM